MAFPTDFRFGVATGAVPIGGGTSALELSAGLGVDTFQFPLSWSRILPLGRGEVSAEGVSFYRELLTALREHGVRPNVTLTSGDLPQVLVDEGGWANRDTAAAFAEYARVAAREFGDLVDLWITLSAPWATAFLGYASGAQAPGRKDPATALAAAHHLNLAHGLATAAIRAELGGETRVGIALNIHVTRPENPTDGSHMEAVRRVDHVGNHIFLGPLLEGSYPTELVQSTRNLSDWSFVQPGDLAITRQRIDALGVIYHRPRTVRSRDGAASTSDRSPWVGCDDLEFVPPAPPTAETDWEIDPSGLYDALAALDSHYSGTPLMVMEDSATFSDELISDERRASASEQRRISYVRAHLAEVHDVIAAGIDVRGYLVWMLPNSSGTLEPVSTESYGWYRDLIAGERTLATELAASAPTVDRVESSAGARPARGLRAWLKKSGGR